VAEARTSGTARAFPGRLHEIPVKGPSGTLGAQEAPATMPVNEFSRMFGSNSVVGACIVHYDLTDITTLPRAHIRELHPTTWGVAPMLELCEIPGNHGRPA
jgi:hypothetical protein